MARVDLNNPSPRCAACRQPPRWCICAGLTTVASPLRIDVLMHRNERWRPSSTGRLIKRVFPDSGQHFTPENGRLDPATIRVPGRELLVLHPAGEALTAGLDPAALQVLLLDGSWSEATHLRREVSGWGRLVSLPMAGESRYWLRTQQEADGRFSTVEALLFLLAALGLEAERRELNLQFELLVYAGLRARGRKELAEKFLETSPIRGTHADLIAQLNVSRPR